MGELANYSIETDQIVLLAFRDGRRLRVHVSRLSRYLEPRDLEKVRAALKLRRDFIRKHMPKTVLVLAAGTALGVLVLGGKMVATIMNQPAKPPAGPPHTVIVRSQPLPEPSVAPSLSPTPAVKGAATVAAVIHPRSVHRFLKHRHGAASLAKVVPAVTSPSPLPSPSVPLPSPPPAETPPPLADNNPPAGNPAPSPTPIPNQGQVLGDSTGPPQ